MFSFFFLIISIEYVEALVTGLTNKEVAEHLLGLKKRREAKHTSLTAGPLNMS